MQKLLYNLILNEMSKVGNLSDETKNLVLDLAAEFGLERFINVEPLNVLKSKQIIKVSKANSTTEYVAKKVDMVCVYIYEKAFERLTKEQQELIVRDALNYINYDSEKGKVIIGCPSITVSIDGLSKYGEELLNASECGVHAIEQIIEEEKEEKRNKKKKK